MSAAASPDRDWRRLEADDGLLLRAVTMDDAERVLAVHGDPRVYTLDPADLHRNVRQSREFLRPHVQHWASYGFGYWAVLVPRPMWEGGRQAPEISTATACSRAWAASAITRWRGSER